MVNTNAESKNGSKKSWMLHKYTLSGLVIPLVLVLDQWTKFYVHTHFALYESSSVVDGFFSLTYVRNTGAAFGVLAQADPAFRVPFFIAIPLVALAAIGWLIKKLPNYQSLTAFSLALVLSGALGNLIDRLVYGFVVDFLLFYNQSIGQFPAFNVADSAITVGVALLMIEMIKNPDTLGSEAKSGPAA